MASLKERLETPPQTPLAKPDDTWERIAASAFNAAPAANAKPIYRLGWLVAAAAVCLLILGGAAYWLWSVPSAPGSYSATTTEPTLALQQPVPTTDRQAPTPADNAPQTALSPSQPTTAPTTQRQTTTIKPASHTAPASRQTAMPATKEQENHSDISASETAEANQLDTHTDTYNTQAASNETRTASTEVNRASAERLTADPISSPTAQTLPANVHDNDPSLSISSYWNGQRNGSTATGSDGSAMYANNYKTLSFPADYTLLKNQPPVDTYNEASFTHDRPLNIGLRMAYHLSPRLMLETGVGYTYLHATLQYNGGIKQSEQKLHYLGVPLGINYNVWVNGPWRAYIGSGLRIDRCIISTLDGQSMGLHPWQLSAMGKVGVVYMPTRHLGLFAEPALTHYFSEGSRLKTYFKDKPTTLTFNLGLMVMY